MEGTFHDFLLLSQCVVCAKLCYFNRKRKIHIPNAFMLAFCSTHLAQRMEISVMESRGALSQSTLTNIICGASAPMVPLLQNQGRPLA